MNLFFLKGEQKTKTIIQITRGGLCGLILCGFSLVHAAKSSSHCLRLLEGGSGRTALEQGSPEQLTSVHNWLFDRGWFVEGYPLPELAQRADFQTFLQEHGVQWGRLSSREDQESWVLRFFLDRWKKWGQQSPVQIAMDQFIELRSLGLDLGFAGLVSPAEVSDSLKLLSQANKERILRQLQQKSAVDSARITALESQFRLHFPLQVHLSKLILASEPSQSKAPLVTDKSLAQYSLSYGSPFYTELSSEARSVAVDLFFYPPSSKQARPFTPTDSRAERIYIRDEVIQRRSFVIPYLQGPKDLYQLVAQFRPSAIEEFVNEQRLFLGPTHGNEDALHRLDFESWAKLFPSHEYHQRLAHLRRQIAYFILTPEDARALVERALLYYLAGIPRESDQEMILAHFAWDPDKFIRQTLGPWMGFPRGFEMRVSGSIAPNDWTGQLSLSSGRARVGGKSQSQGFSTNPLRDYQRMDPNFD